MNHTTAIALIGVACLFGFLTGLHDSAKLVATVISSRALSGRVALGLVALVGFWGAFALGTAVAETIGRDLAHPRWYTVPTLFAALLSAVTWSLFTWWRGIPSSASHALVGGLVGALSMQAGISAINPNGLRKVLLALLFSPVLGLLGGYLFTRLAFWLCRHATPRVNNVLRVAQIPTTLALALSHGSNSAQRTMGVMALSLIICGVQPQFIVPPWVIALSAIVMASGMGVGGWRLIKTMGARFYRIRPIHGFSAQLASASVIAAAALWGGPVSSTHVVSAAILGAGSAERMNKVRWNIAEEVVTAWLLTIPGTALISAVFYQLALHFVAAP
ncbi:MAG: inorganic phosphate transporter [Anaerolineae bacterium]|nr:inorganic phosphate transporter [Anaerolineae bacterium]